MKKSTINSKINFMKAIILARVSTKEQAEENQSIPAQTGRLTEYVHRKGLELLQVFEIAESSTKDSRKKFEKILEVIKNSKEPLALVVETVDRLQRSFKESVVLDDLRKQGKLEIHFVRENLILSKDANSAQLLQWDMGVMFARSYVLQLSDNVKRGNEQKWKDGEWAGKAPIGYINTQDVMGKVWIELNEVKSPLILKVFELYATGNYSMKMVALESEKWGLVGYFGKPLKARQIECILLNPFYYGYMLVKGKEYKHKYEPIISYNLFLKCQKVRQGYNKQPFQYAAKPFIFRGLISCEVCGCTISPEMKKGKFIYYSCTNYKGKCKRVYVPEKDLLKPVYEYLDQLCLPQDGIDYVVGNLKSTTEAEQDFYRQNIATLQAEYNKIDDRISKMFDEKMDGSITAEMYDKKLREYKAKQFDITQQIQEHSAADENHYLTASKLLDICKLAKQIFESSEPNEKRQFLNFLLQNCRLSGKEPMFTLKPVFAGIVTAHKNANWLGSWDSNPGPIGYTLF